MKLKLEKDAANTIVVTLKEKQTLSAPYWLFVFRNQETPESYQSIILTDTSSYKERFNEFTLTLPTDLDLSTTGDWTYEVYEQTSDSNLDPDQADNLCETGMARLDGTGTTEYFYSNNT